jgi:hypothetical protein
VAKFEPIGRKGLTIYVSTRAIYLDKITLKSAFNIHNPARTSITGLKQTNFVEQIHAMIAGAQFRN